MKRFQKSFLVSFWLFGIYAHGEAIDLGNGGLSKKNGEDRLDLVEHVDNAICPLVQDNQKYFKEVTPNLVARLQELAQVEPMLSLALWTDLNDLSLRECAFPIEKIKGCPTPANQGEIVSGCRLTAKEGFGKKVYLASKDVIQKHSRPEYVLLHESLHSVIAGNDQNHQQNVNEFSNYLYENQGSLRQEIIRKLLVDEMNSGSYLGKAFIVKDVYRVSYLEPKKQKTFESVVRLVMSGEASEKNLCVLKQAGLSAPAETANAVLRLLQALVNAKYRWPLWPESCDDTPSWKTRLYEILGSDYKKYFISIGTVSRSTLGSDSFDRDLFDCNFYVKPEQMREYAAAAWAWGGLKIIQDDLAMEQSPKYADDDADLARVYFEHFPEVVSNLRDQPRYKDYVGYGFSPISSDRVAEEAKDNAAGYQRALIAQRYCRETYAWNAQSGEWVKKSEPKSSKTIFGIFKK